MDDSQDRFPEPRLTEWSAERGRFLAPRELEPSLFSRRISTRFPDAVTGRHLAFGCIADDGGYYFCKYDTDGHPARATEWVATKLAAHVGLVTAPCAVIQGEAGDTYFGSRQVDSPADRVLLENFLATRRANELGQLSGFPGQYLSMLRTFDLFIDNADRGVDNFVLARDGSMTRLVAIDFASARLLDCNVDRFPVELDRTMLVGKFHQQTHGAYPDSAIEMLGRLAAIPASVVEALITEMPDEWMTARSKGEFNDFWSDGRREKRIANLRAALTG